jgi:extracellular factor (EF) 3-hydroxypalmitic acid methyl ester biosynthesis protein
MISKNIASAFDEFKDWHFELKASLDHLNVSGQDEVNYLNEILPKERAYYFKQINRLGELTEGFEETAKKDFFKKIAETGLHEILKGAPYFYHSIFKPRGYAGDAEMMSLVYRNTYEGVDSFSKLLHKIGTDCDACIAIRNRKDLLLHSFSEFQGGKVLSLAAGPAQEIYEYKNGKNDKEFLALDHDIETLKNARRRSRNLKYGIANAFHIIKGNKKYLIPKKNRLERCHPKSDMKGIKKLFLPFKYSIGELKKNEFDLIYSAGLYDYIKTFDHPKKGTIALTKELFDALKPNGRLLIGNISPKLSIGVKWAMECLCDWYLIHRTEEEVLDFAKSIPPKEIASINVISEETGVNWFLDIRKK